MKYSLGIDIGGTNIVLGLTNENGEILHLEQFPTKHYDVLKDYLDELTKRIILLCEKVEDKSNILGVGIGAPNSNYYRGTIEYAPNLQFKGIINLKQEIEEKLLQNGYTL